MMFNRLVDLFILKVVDGQQQEGFPLDEIHDVKITSYRDGQHYGNIRCDGRIVEIVDGDSRDQILDKAQNFVADQY